MLVARKKQVKVKLARDPARKVFSAVGQHRARVQILFKAAVIDTHAYVTYRAQTGTGSTRGVKSLGDAQLFQILGLLPDVYIIGDNACDADAQAVFQRVDSLRKQRQRAAQILYIGAQAHAVHGAQICAQRVIAEVEIVVAKCEIITAHGIEGFGHRMMGKFVRVRQIILHQRRALQRVSAVQHQRVSVLVDLCGQVQQAGAFAASGGVVDREDMPVRIGRINNFKSTFHVQPLANFMRIFVESHSTASTKTISPARMAPASLQR